MIAYVWNVMCSKGGLSAIMMIGCTAALLMLSTGCTKEEIAAPAHSAKMHKSSADPANGNSGFMDPSAPPPPNGSNITDDGDDQGDREHSTLSTSSKP
jgi:hypothetical protein